MNKLSGILFLLVLSFIFSHQLAYAQEVTPTPATGPVYIVQPGDTLTAISQRFNIPVDILMSANGLTNPNQINAGARIIIPGLQGISGTLVTEIVSFGENLRSIQRRNQISLDLLRRLNRIVSPNELYAGVSLIVLQESRTETPINRSGLLQGESLLELAVKQGSTPWELSSSNDLINSWSLIPGEPVFSNNGSDNSQVNGLPPAFSSVVVSSLPLVQGKSITVQITTNMEAVFNGILVDKFLYFFPETNNTWVALQGVHAMQKPGVYPLKLEAVLANGEKQSFEQMVLLLSGNYPKDPVLIVDPATIDPAVTVPESEKIEEIVTIPSSDRLWEDKFISPAFFPDCFTSLFGNRRSYNNSPYEYFHTGLDFCGGAGLTITAPANGRVVYAGSLPVRGNATIIDHGWGVFSGFWHQSEIFVNIGQEVKAGDVIGHVGATGRVTGAHLHWEVWVNGVQVDPLDWLEFKYP